MRLKAFKDLTRIDQTLFALPFIVSALLLSQAPFSVRWFLVFFAFLTARISGMAFNQLIDRKIDARNPRTQQRVLPSGRLLPYQVALIGWGALLLFLGLAFQTNRLTLSLACVAAPLLYLYSYMKRIHYSCHFVLGLIYFLAPLMTCALLKNTLSPPILCLGGASACLIIGNDIIYAIQDYEFDCQQALCSIPSKFGIQKSLVVALSLHFFCLLSLWGVGFTAELPKVYYLLLPAAGAFFLYYHLHVRAKMKKNLEPSFFYCNIALSFSTLLFICLSRL